MNTLRTRWWRQEPGKAAAPDLPPDIQDRTDTTAICFSGGGSRSMSATVGQLRALAHLGLLSGVRYISSVSGGSWGSAPFLWGNHEVGDDALLGPLGQPEALTLTSLDAPLVPTEIVSAATNPMIPCFLEALRREVPVERLWTETVGGMILSQFGLHDAEQPAHLAWSEAHLADIAERNPTLAGARFQTARAPERLPLHVIQSCGIGPYALSPLSEEDPQSFEVSPIFGGNPQMRRQLYTSRSGAWQEARMGGGYMESFALGAPALVEAGEREAVVEQPARPYTLAEAVGTSSAAFGGAAAELAPSTIRESLNPLLPVWPLEEGAESTDFTMGDGGVLENYGLLSMLRRGVQRAVVFINTNTPLDLDYEPRASVPDQDSLDTFLPALFGFRVEGLGIALQHNTVFGGEDWVNLIEALQARKRAGQPLVHRMIHLLRPNQFWSVRGGREVEIVWCYLERVPQWEARLLKETARAIEQGHRKLRKGELADFPHYATVGQHKTADTCLSATQARLLAHLSSWAVLAEADDFRAVLGRR